MSEEETPLIFNGFVDDDIQLIYRILRDNWDNIEIPNVIFYADEDNDISQFNFRTGEVAVKIYADEISSAPKGISFDSVEEYRTVRLDIRTIDRVTAIRVSDEIRRIISLYRLRPGNDYDTMYMSGYMPIYPSYKFYRMSMAITLRRYMFMLPYVDSTGNH